MDKAARYFLLCALVLVATAGCTRLTRRLGPVMDPDPVPGPTTISPPTESVAETVVPSIPVASPTVTATAMASPSPTATTIPSPTPLPTADAFWQSWNGALGDLGNWLNADPTVDGSSLP